MLHQLVLLCYRFKTCLRVIEPLVTLDAIKSGLSWVVVLQNDLRVFLSLDIDDPKLISRITDIQSKLNQSAAKMKIVEQENIHFTWRFFGDTHPKIIDQIHSELSKLEYDAFPIQIKGVGTFPNIRQPRIIWVGVSANADKLQVLKSETDQLLSNVGYAIERRKFTPHATIARVRHVINRDALTQNLRLLEDESIGLMEVTGLRMTKSTLTSSGSIYETLWEIPFKMRK